MQIGLGPGTQRARPHPNHLAGLWPCPWVEDHLLPEYYPMLMWRCYAYALDEIATSSLASLYSGQEHAANPVKRRKARVRATCQSAIIRGRILSQKPEAPCMMRPGIRESGASVRLHPRGDFDLSDRRGGAALRAELCAQPQESLAALRLTFRLQLSAQSRIRSHSVFPPSISLVCSRGRTVKAVCPWCST